MAGRAARDGMGTAAQLGWGGATALASQMRCPPRDAELVAEELISIMGGGEVVAHGARRTCFSFESGKIAESPPVRAVNPIAREVALSTSS